MIKDYERRNYIQAGTIYNKLKDEKILRNKITIVIVPKANARL
jgi:hypothetical protein